MKSFAPSPDPDLIRGTRHHAVDVEQTAERCLTMGCPGRVAAFSLDGERVVVVIELRRVADRSIARTATDYTKIKKAISGAIAARHDLILGDLVLLEADTMPMFVGGRVSRSGCEKAYRDGALQMARDEYGFLAGCAYEFRSRAAGATGEDPARGTHQAAQGEMRTSPCGRMCLEFLLPQVPSSVATLYARTDEEYSIQMAHLRDHVERGHLRPSDLPRADHAVVRPGQVHLHRAASHHLFFVYTGWAEMLMMTLPDFMRITGLSRHNVMVLRDVRRRYYVDGISRDIPNLLSLMSYERGVIDGSGEVSDVHAIGTSMGAFSAVVAGYHLGLMDVWAFGLQRTVLEGTDGVDLRALLRAPNGVTRYHLYFCEGNATDHRCAAELEGLPGVSLKPQPGFSHNVVRSMYDSGRLANFFGEAGGQCSDP